MSKERLMGKETFKRFDAAAYLKSEAAVAAYLAAAAEGGDDTHFARALGTVARAGNMSALARETGLTRQGLHKALSEGGKPSLATAMRVLSALGLKFSISKSALKPAAKSRRKASVRAPATPSSGPGLRRGKLRRGSRQAST